MDPLHQHPSSTTNSRSQGSIHAPPRPSRIPRVVAAVLVPALALVLGGGCVGGSDESLPPPVAHDGPAAELALATKLPEAAPETLPGLENVFHLSESIISGGEPMGEQAFDQLQAMGVRTLICVDGKVPDAEAAAERGMTYVHVPLQYSGISDEQLLDLAKTFREQEAPFYVHCFHGQHRGPAAAAVGRLILDGAPRETAVAEMAQWCGTSPKYAGLFETIARAELPDSDDSADHDFDFPPAHAMEGVRGSMVDIPRSWDPMKISAQAGWAVDPDHPDVDPLREAEILAGLFEQFADLDETRAQPEEFRRWAEVSRADSAELAELLAAARKGRPAHEPLGQAERIAADELLASIDAACDACHVAYRN